MKFTFFAFFAVFVSAVYGATEYLIASGAKLDNFAIQSFLDGDKITDAYVGFEQEQDYGRFVKYETKGDWFQIAAESGGVILKEIGNGLVLKTTDNESIYYDENPVHFKNVKGILVSYNLARPDRLCFSFECGLHLESTRKYHPRFYLTIKEDNIVKAGHADEEPKLFDEDVLAGFHFEEYESEHSESIKVKEEIKRVESDSEVMSDEDLGKEELDDGENIPGSKIIKHSVHKKSPERRVEEEDRKSPRKKRETSTRGNPKSEGGKDVEEKDFEIPNKKKKESFDKASLEKVQIEKEHEQPLLFKKSSEKKLKVSREPREKSPERRVEEEDRKSPRKKRETSTREKVPKEKAKSTIIEKVRETQELKSTIVEEYSTDRKAKSTILEEEYLTRKKDSEVTGKSTIVEEEEYQESSNEGEMMKHRDNTISKYKCIFPILILFMLGFVFFNPLHLSFLEL